MRVISGKARGRKLKQPLDMNIRPTSDMIKESMFNIIQFELEGRQVLDLFAGTGQLGIEALSRGADHCVFIEESRDSTRIIVDNIKTCELEDDATIVRGESLSYLERGDKFDIIFVDPPYDTSLLDKALQKIIQFDILKVNGIILCESKVEKALPEVSAPYLLRKEYRYGKIKLSLYTREA